MLSHDKRMREKWQGSVARPLPAPPSGANLKGFGSVFQTALRGLSNRSIVVVGNYLGDPMTAVSCRATTNPLRPRRSCFAPAEILDEKDLGGGAGYCPRVRWVYYDRRVSP